jgi:hypothetical protein
VREEGIVCVCEESRAGTCWGGEYVGAFRKEIGWEVYAYDVDCRENS